MKAKVEISEGNVIINGEKIYHGDIEISSSRGALIKEDGTLLRYHGMVILVEAMEATLMIWESSPNAIYGRRNKKKKDSIQTVGGMKLTKDGKELNEEGKAN